MNDCVEVFVPGRLCILGEHSDWAASYRKQNHSIEKGYAIVAGLNLGIYLRGWKSDRFSYEFIDKKLELTHDELVRYDNKDFFEYVVASAKVIVKKYSVGGAMIICERMTLPMKKGLASSAAICVAIIRMYNLLYNLNLSVEEEMSLAYFAEQSIGSMCGKMDQICAYGQGLRVVQFNGNNIKVNQLKVKKELYFVLVDLHVSKDTKKILSDLNSVFPFPQNGKEKKLFSFLGTKNKQFVEKAISTIENGDIVSLANILNEYQKQFDENVACFSDELSAPVLHELMSKVCEIDEVLACKGVGSQGDGMAQILISDKNFFDNVIEKIGSKYLRNCYKLIVGQTKLNAIIPIAGMGTRLYPFTYVVDKAFLPIVYKKRVYPALMMIIQELYFSNCINDVNLIINDKQVDMIRKMEELLGNENVNINLTYDYQIRNGFGGALSSSRYVNETGFSLICLGDYIYRSEKMGDCTCQLVKFWREQGEAVVGIKKICVSDTSSYGVVYGTWIDEKILRIEGIVEKPEPLYAQEKLMLECCGKKEIYAFFGQYIVNNDTLRNITLSKKESEIGFSEYLDKYAKQHKLYGYVVNGDSFDFGNANNYYESFVNYGKE